MRADYLERVRRHSFLVTLGLTAYFAYLSLPPNPSPYTTLDIAGHRGIYNSAWVGCQVALMTSAFLSIAGFYLVKNAIERDRLTGVGQILAATPITKGLYTLGKWASNLAVLATMVATLAVCAIGMQLLRGEDRRIDLTAVFVPFVVVTMPAMAVTAAFAVIFETLRRLRGGVGNVVFFFLWGFLFAGSDMVNAMRGGGIGSVVGISTIVPSMRAGVSNAFHVPVGPTSFNLGFNIKDKGIYDLQTFRWEGMAWTGDLLWPRLVWTLLGVGLALIAAIPFDRFDVARDTYGKAHSRKQRRERQGLEQVVVSDGGEQAASRVVDHGAAVTTPAAALRGSRFTSLLGAELRLAIRSLPRAWSMVAAGLALACWF